MNCVKKTDLYERIISQIKISVFFSQRNVHIVDFIKRKERKGWKN